MSSPSIVSNTPLDLLAALRDYGGARVTEGLSDDVIARFLDLDPNLGQAIREAFDAHQAARAEVGSLLAGDETELLCKVQEGYVNFYSPATVNPYLALGARGPWIVSSHGAVIHDNGGYGMLGQGHAPPAVLEAMSRPYVMANVMTPSLSQARLMKRLRAEIGHSRAGGCPFAAFQCMNSGSEAVALATRISDVHAKEMTAPGAPKEGRTVRYLALVRGFHGRTFRPARVSHSTAPAYERYLNSFADHSDLVIVPANDIPALERAFTDAERNGAWFEMMFVEPVQGEGSPGVGMTRAFYDAARRLTRDHGTLLLVDGIQAGLRATGALSVVDYPGFEDCEAPDFETYSKALNAGQYPLSVLALSAQAASLYRPGIYGNTMTTNPRALEVGCAVLDAITPELRENIRARGRDFVAGLEALSAEVPGMITEVHGTGLLFAAEIRADVPVVGTSGLEVWLRRRGLGVIHGGKNALRFTPHFGITQEEVAMLLDLVRRALYAFRPA